jgi:hypothetical protein
LTAGQRFAAVLREEFSVTKYLSVLIVSQLLSGVALGAPRTIDRAPLGGGLNLDYYVSAPPGADVTTILIAVHGYTRDANRTFDAAQAAADDAGRGGDTLIVAPIFQVGVARAAKCRFHGVPGASAGDALWRCGDWATGGQAENGPLTSFAAMDRLQAVLLTRYPAARDITIAGFSAGGQFVQHYVGFARPPAGVESVRYVVADPSEFVYFDSWRPEPGAADCPGYDDWKFGTENLPANLGRGAAAARAAYAAADVQYIEGALDTGRGKGTAYRLLETNCAAELEGPYRLQRGQAYAVYDMTRLAKGAHRLTIVPGCAHSVTCVFPAEGAAAVLFGGEGKGG